MKIHLLYFMLLSTSTCFSQEPQLFWGASNGKSGICPEESMLAIQTETYEGGYTILDWEMSIENQIKKGNGSYLSKEISPWIHEFRKDSLKIAIRVNYRNNHTNRHSTLQNHFFLTNSIYKSDLTKSYSGFILIDKNEANYEALFNADNPKSFLGMIYQNSLPSPAFMSDQLVNDIRAKNPETTFLQSTGYQSNVPLISTQLDSLGRIVDSIRKLDEGYYAFIYPNPKEYAYDLTDITRIILILDTVENPKTREKYVGISRNGLAKKYPKSGKYEIVLTFSYSEFMNFSGFHLLLETDRIITQKLTDPNSYYQTEFKEKCLQTTAKNLSSEKRDYNYFPYFTNFPDRRDQKKSLLVSHLYEDVGKFKLDNAHAYNNVNLLFDHVNYILGEESDVPLTNEYGDPLEKILDGGAIVFVYPPRDTIITWVETDSIKVYVHYQLELNDESIPVLQAHTLYFAKQVGSQNIAFLEFILEEKSDWKSPYYSMELFNREYYGYFDKEFPVSGLQWVELIAQTFNKNPSILKPGNKKDTALLFQEFNLEKKGNLLNIQLK
ncbi:hypothetical protein [Fluviicola sp.]|uniref:hypothetical protein n=1 Tax=Fluviicola sp. TaxID=1917219 RepID=UPI003D2CD75B